MQRYFVNHLVGGLHFYSFWYVLAMVAGMLGRWQEDFNAGGILAAPTSL